MIKRCGIEDFYNVYTAMSDERICNLLFDDGVNGGNLHTVVRSFLSSPSIIILMPSSSAVFFGMPSNSICLDVHVAISQVDGKKSSFILGRECIGWVKQNTRYRKLVAKIPAFNKKAVAFAIGLGFKVEGRISSSFVKDGIIYDEVILGLSI